MPFTCSNCSYTGGILIHDKHLKYQYVQKVGGMDGLRCDFATLQTVSPVASVSLHITARDTLYLALK